VDVITVSHVFGRLSAAATASLAWPCSGFKDGGAVDGFLSDSHDAEVAFI
jgi:hypothetical protein